MSIENVSKQEYNVTEFKKGVKAASYQAGFYTGLVNIGIEDEDIIEILKLNMKLQDRKIE